MKIVDHEELVARAAGLTACFAARAARYDANTEFPHEDFEDLANAGLLATAVPVSRGGYGIAMSNGDPWTQWRVTTAIAAGDLSLGRCYEGHVNAVDLLNAFGTNELKEELFPGVVTGEVRLVIWGSEPIRKDTEDLYNRLSGQTIARKTDGGWLLSGAKAYATSAGGASHIIVTAAVDDASLSPLDQQQWFLIEASDPGISIDYGWWKALGMRATVSHKVDLKDVFVPSTRRLFSTNQYLANMWQARFLPHFCASFLGSATQAYNFALSYANERGRTRDPIVQHLIADTHVCIDVLEAHLAATARAWVDGDPAKAAVKSNVCRAVGERLAMRAVQLAIRVGGATALLESYPLGRILRDLQMYVRHESIDKILTSIGQACLGLTYDPNFARSDAAARIDAGRAAKGA